MKIVERLDLGKLSTFIPNKSLPVYNWLYFKEGFSRDLVIELIDSFSLSQKHWVLDPFCGVGTTLLACRERGINAIGYDVLPLAIFATRVKLRDYDIERLKDIGKDLLKKKFRIVKSNIPNFLKKYFSPYTLQDIYFFKDEIEKLENPEKDFFLLALINAAMKCSFVFKDGGILKVRKRHVPPFRNILRRQIFRMIRDLENFEAKSCEVIVEERDARNIDLVDCINAVITSPPYLNKIEYTKVYEIEHLLLFGKSRVSSLRSFIGITNNKEEEFKILDKLSSNLPIQAKRYFKDLYIAFEKIYRACRKGAKLGIVIGNACFPNRIVEVDKIFSKLGERIGFSPKKIIVLNKRVCTTPSRRKIGVARESLLIWVKE